MLDKFLQIIPSQMKRIVLGCFVGLLCMSGCAPFPSKESVKSVTYANLQNSKTRPKGLIQSYVDKEGIIYRSGDRFKIGRPSSGKTFAHITEGDGILIPLTPLTAQSSGFETEIESFRIAGNKRIGYRAYAKGRGVIGMNPYIIDVENAIESGELKTAGSKSDQALSELKHAKEKLDLQLISQEEYDKIKNNLSQFIK